MGPATTKAIVKQSIKSYNEMNDYNWNHMQKILAYHNNIEYRNKIFFKRHRLQLKTMHLSFFFEN